MKERVEILRRIAERGRASAERSWNSEQIDLWNHILAEIQVLKREVNDYQV